MTAVRGGLSLRALPSRAEFTVTELLDSIFVLGGSCFEKSEIY